MKKCFNNNQYFCKGGLDDFMIIGGVCYEYGGVCRNPGSCGRSILSGNYLGVIKQGKSECINLKHLQAVSKELVSAKKKHPVFPADIVHMVAIMQEEAGESTRASLRYVHDEGGTLEELKVELIQTAAMCFRVLENLEEE